MGQAKYASNNREVTSFDLILKGARAYITPTHSVTGPISPDQRTVTLYEKALIVDCNCNVVEYSDDVLVFQFRIGHEHFPGGRCDRDCQTASCFAP